GVFQMMNNLTEGMAEQQSGSGEVEQMVAPQAETAEAFDRRRGFAASRAERGLDRDQIRPAFRTCPSPPALLNRRVTDATCAWEKEVEDVVEQSAFGETQRAKPV
ncbi:MAG TPA: hypothetical protein VKY31_10480, partial [Terriglobia bacterium]|nr:hypothetical protein [Terriglobia bacterium]